MRAVNLIPEELRPRIPGDGDPRVAYGVLGVLAILLVMVLVAISYSNKISTIEDQTAAINAEAQGHRSKVAAVVTTPDSVSGDVKERTLLVGGLAKSRFPWGTALYDLSRAIPSDTTLNSIDVASASPTAASSSGASGASMTLGGCTSSWVGYSRFMTWLKTMPGVAKVESTSSAVSESGGQGEDDKRTKNCGPAPLAFGVVVTYLPRKIDLVGLPKPEAGSSTATGSGVPAASQTPAPVTPPTTGGQ